jgi:hypothetical protein
MSTQNAKNNTRARDALDWEAGEPIPAPEAIHKDGESAWALFHELSHQHNQRFAATAPMTLPPPALSPEAGWASTLPAGGAAAAPVRTAARRRETSVFSLESAMLVARRNNRVCPRPQQWAEFMKLLPPRKGLRGTQQPPAPATGAAWAVTPALTKRLCFREQIEWAERAGAIESVMGFMMGLTEQDWLHIGED